jgi:hypothetical protein
MHTARRAAASIRQGFEHRVALGGDLLAQVDGGGLREGGLRVALDAGAAFAEALFEAVEEDILAMSSSPMVRPSRLARRGSGSRDAGLRSLVGSRSRRSLMDGSPW